ncbi:hypothetical protein [Nocardioides speluncae]|uniref:hypothetical protein n=1 Tax=Nocardioides speluncae TaxID=2670337 RepID=UPI000D6942B4|nr:hypothetical protein [Nocardioides speluncae]
MPDLHLGDLLVAFAAALVTWAILGPTQGDDSYPPSDGLNMFGWPVPTDNSWLIFLGGVAAFLVLATALTALRAEIRRRRGIP